MYKSFQGALNWTPMMPRDASLLDNYKTDHRCFSSLGRLVLVESKWVVENEKGLILSLRVFFFLSVVNVSNKSWRGFDLFGEKQTVVETQS